MAKVVKKGTNSLALWYWDKDKQNETCKSRDSAQRMLTKVRRLRGREGASASVALGHLGVRLQKQAWPCLPCTRRMKNGSETRCEG